jgi:membrane protein implicated in regulation of membrane protease activity
MDTTPTLNRHLETIAWGAFFIWWGITELFQSLPEGIGAVGIGLIMLSLNAARSRSGLPTSGFTTTLGILALVLGGLELAGSVLSLPFELPVFAILLIALGVIMLTRELRRTKNE